MKAVEASLEPAAAVDATKEQNDVDTFSEDDVVAGQSEANTLIVDELDDEMEEEEELQEDPQGIIANEDTIKEESSGFFSFFRNIIMFGGFVSAAYYWNQTQASNDLKYDYRQTENKQYGYSKPDEMENVFNSWNKDPNIGNRARGQSLIDLGEDDEIRLN